MKREELALQFLPRLDPLAHALKLTFQGAHQEITNGGPGDRDNLTASVECSM